MKNIFIVFACLFAVFVFGNAAKASSPSPTIISAQNGYMQEQKYLFNPFITGLTASGTEVLIYIDGAYVGMAEINRGASGTDNFYYKHDRALPEGAHSVMAVARDKTSLVLSVPAYAEIIVGPLPAPTLIAPNEKTVTAKVKPVITGLVPSGTSALIYIDGVYNGKLSDLVHLSGTANFAYIPFLNLSRGNHVAWAITEDMNGRKSGKSNVLAFRIEDPMPAPTLFAPIASSEVLGAPVITGVVKSNSLVRIYIDHKLAGEVKAGSSKTGAVGFIYKHPQGLTAGSHLIYAVAADERGKESSWSSLASFTVNAPAVVRGEGRAEVGEQEEKENGDEQDLEAGQADNNEALAPENSTDNKTEDSSGGNELPIKLIIFIAFLLGVIGWIIWVNKELIKEKGRQ